MNLVVESGKLTVCLIAMIMGMIKTKTDFGKTIRNVNYREHLTTSLYYFPPAFCYYINNNLAVYMQKMMDAATYQLQSNLKILTTAICYQLILRKKLTRKEWFSLILLFLATTYHSASHFNNKDDHSFHINLTGIIFIIIYSTISGIAGTYTEYILKKNRNINIFLQNIYLYIFGILCNSGTILSTSSIQFKDFNFYVRVIIITQIFSGIVMSLIFKYSNNIVRLFVIGIATILNSFLTIVVFNYPLEAAHFISLAGITSSLFIFYL
ncbi:hypothetical protein SNEBB_002056 [Seison nebaliae]|nr:hypothetical protein SNEBB_002056 [Seison nebaliae]